MHSNEPPAAAELAYAQAVVSNTAAQIGSLDEEIVLLQTRLKQMEDERAALAIYHQRSLPILSPVRRMPPEILSEIFTRWRLSQVSRRWREIALSTPSLWSLVYVSGKRQADPLPMVQAQVQRARDLKIHFYGAQNGTGDATARIKLFTFLSEHSVRWEELFLRLTAELVPLLPPLRGRLPSLRRLSIIWHDERSQIGVDSVECFETAPFLEDVEFSSEFRYTPIPFPTDLLTSYRIQGSLESHQHILQMAPNIIEARVAITYGLDQPWPEPIGPTIDMLHLKRLYVTHIEILDYFRAPSLEEISMSTDKAASVVM
ncbi:hypothetical protein FB45DRAFT_1039260 [Roridomyces roridus]|uniref:F-box domain-containing protein n=1 Tax=Roridomyces roridus TaxID=1738132 RepID=A0AAD7FAM1_9AGAR|nr:hypothetical protein FB45DRAFT_1039260 [Roridomyces roridus]